MILANARILTFDAANRVLDNGAVEIRGSSIESVGPHSPCADVIDCRGKLLMPALINCHTHLYSALARGITLSGAAPKNFPEILKKLWWRLDRALTPDAIYHSALIGLLESARNGVGTVIDHHSSPNACAGSLDLIAQAFHEVGLRGAVCYETSDRNGPRQALEGIRENIRFLEHNRDGLVAGAFGLHASFTLSDKTLRRCVEANESLRAGFHIHVAEDRSDAGAVARLRDHGILDERTLAAHCIHINARDRKTLSHLGVNVVHNPQSNCNNAVGAADLPALFRQGVLTGLGSDGCSPRMWDEFKTAFHVQKLRARDPRVAYAEVYAAAFFNNRAIVKKVFGMDVGRIETGAKADLILVDYFPPAPISSDNLFGHLMYGISNASVDSLIVEGRYVVKDKQCVNVDEARIAASTKPLHL